MSPLSVCLNCCHELNNLSSEPRPRDHVSVSRLMITNSRPTCRNPNQPMRPVSTIRSVRTTGSLYLLRAVRSLAFLLLLFPSPKLHAQTGALDPNFTHGPIGVTINRIAEQTDGQILVAGQFTSFHATTISNIVRLNPNGTVDPSFAPPPITVADGLGGTLNGTLYTLVAQPDGKVLIGGGFTSLGGVARTNLARLNANGSLDTSFDVSTGDAKVVWRLARQPDGTTYVGGGFDRLGGATRPGLARLTSSGALDTTFAPNLSPYIGPSVRCIAVQTDGKLLIGGVFATFTGTLNYFGVLRLNANGTVDGTFTPPQLPAVATSRIEDLVIQADGKIVVAGGFTAIGGVTRQSIARLESNGAVDQTWPGPGVFALNSSFRDVKAMQATGGDKILIAGPFEQYNGETAMGIARLNANGTRDNTFNSPGVNVFRAVAMTQQTNGGILVGGTLSVPGSSTSLVRLAGGVTQPTLTFSIQPGGVLRFAVPAGFKLQKVLDLGDTWGDVSGSTSIDVPMTDPRGFFQLTQ